MRFIPFQFCTFGVRLALCTTAAISRASLASRSHTLYVGVTGSLQRRVFEHKRKEHGGFTARYNCDRLVWFDMHQDVQQAIAREKELKGWRRSKKIALIESTNPAWVDLSRDWYDCEPGDYRRALDRIEI